MKKANIIFFAILGLVLLGGYQIFTKSKSEQVTTPSVSPSPSAQSSVTTELDLLNGQTSALQSQQQGSKPTQQTQKQIKQYKQFPGVQDKAELENSAGEPSKKGVIKTNKGTIEFEIFPDSPKAASNFIFLAKDGFYDGLTFHRVETWVVQGGDPTGTGRGGPGYMFEDEPVTRKYIKGTVAMANSGPNTNGSQFFILTNDTPLDPKYTIFGKVTVGQDIADSLQVGDVMQKVTIESVK